MQLMPMLQTGDQKCKPLMENAPVLSPKEPALAFDIANGANLLVHDFAVCNKE